MPKTISFTGPTHQGGYGDDQRRWTVMLDSIIALCETDTLGYMVVCTGGYEILTTEEEFAKIKAAVGIE